MRAARWLALGVLVGCGASFNLPPDVLADRPHAHATGASAIAFDEDAGPPAVEPTTPILPAVIEKHLSNGIRVLLAPSHDHSIVDFGIVIKRGSEDAAPGFAHLWIQAATSATQDMSRIALFTWLRARGAIATRDAAYSYCMLGIKVLTPLVDETLDVAADAVLRPAIDEEGVRRATRNHSNAVLAARSSSTAYRTLVRALYPAGHAYGDTVVGEDVHPSPADIEAFRRESVTASSLAIVAAGDLDVERFVAHVEARFGKLGGSSPPPKAIEAPAPRARRGVMVASPRDPQVQIAIGFPGVLPGDPDRAALHVASIALRDATLHDLRFVEGATYTTTVFEGVRRGPAPIVLQTSVDPARLVPAVQDIWHAIDHLRDGLSDEETRRFRERAISLFPGRFDTVASTVSQLANLAALDLSPGALAAELEAIRRVTPTDLKRVAEKYMTDQTLQLVVVGELNAIKPAQDLLEYHPAAPPTAPAP